MCEKIHRGFEQTPCKDCEQIVVLRQDNIESLNIYKIVYNQLIVGFNGAIDLNIPAVKIVMDLYDIEDQKTTLNNVMALWRSVFNRAKEKSDK